MIDRFQAILASLRDLFDWLPDNLVGTLILALAALVALAIDAGLVGFLRRILSRRRPFLASLLRGTRRQAQLAVLLVALFIALPAAPFSAATSTALLKILIV